MRPGNTTQPSRRQVLKGMGASLLLPYLRSIDPYGGRPPVRMAFLFFPNGVWGKDWTPEESGSHYALSPTLEPLASVKDQVLVLTGLRNKNANEGEGHYVKTTSLLSGAKVRRTGGKDLRCGTTIDQHAANQLGNRTRIPSLVLGIEPVRTAVDMGYSTVYGSTISWRSPTHPLQGEIRPRQVFERLIRAGRAHPQAQGKSVLDVVQEDARRLKPRLGSEDQAKVAEYFESVRALELRLDRLEPWSDRERDLLDRHPVPAARYRNYQEHVDAMIDLMVLAFQTDATRIISFMFGNSVSGRDFSFLDGVSGSHHPLSHHEAKQRKIAQYQLINRWHVEQFSRLLMRLKETPEGDGTLLDHAMIFLGSGIRDGNAHEPRNLPILLGGQGGHRLNTGRHVRFRKGAPLCGLYATMLTAIGLPTQRFGDSDGNFDQNLLV